MSLCHSRAESMGVTWTYSDEKECMAAMPWCDWTTDPRVSSLSSFCSGASAADVGMFEIGPIKQHTLPSRAGESTVLEDSNGLPPVSQVSRHGREQWVLSVACCSHLSHFGPDLVGGKVWVDHETFSVEADVFSSQSPVYTAALHC